MISNEIAYVLRVALGRAEVVSPLGERAWHMAPVRHGRRAEAGDIVKVYRLTLTSQKKCSNRHLGSSYVVFCDGWRAGSNEAVRALLDVGYEAIYGVKLAEPRPLPPTKESNCKEGN